MTDDPSIIRELLCAQQRELIEAACHLRNATRIGERASAIVTNTSIEIPERPCSDATALANQATERAIILIRAMLDSQIMGLHEPGAAAVNRRRDVA